MSEIQESYGFAKMLVDKDDERTDLPPKNWDVPKKKALYKYMTIHQKKL